METGGFEITVPIVRRVDGWGAEGDAPALDQDGHAEAQAVAVLIGERAAPL
jgi:hypothetical protein